MKYIEIYLDSVVIRLDKHYNDELEALICALRLIQMELMDREYKGDKS